MFDRCEFCDSASDIYCKYKKYLTKIEGSSYNSENDIETSPSSSNHEDDWQASPPAFEPIEPLNRLSPVDAVEMKSSNSTEGVSVSTNRQQTQMYLNRPLTINSNVADCSQHSKIPKQTAKRKLFGNEGLLSKEVSKKSKIIQHENIVPNQTYTFPPDLSDSVVDRFLQRFDQEIAPESVGEPVNNLVIDGAQSLTRDLPGTKQAAAPLQEDFYSHSIDSDCDDSMHDVFQLGVCDDTSTSSDRSRKENNGIRKKINIFERSSSSSSVSDETDSISSTTLNTSRYGRIRKPPSVYTNATMFKGSIKKSDEIMKKASTLINSNKCLNRLSGSSEAIARYCPDQFNILAQTHNSKIVSPQFKIPVNSITASKIRQTTRRFQNKTINSNWRNSSFIEDLPELPHNRKVLKKSTESIVSTGIDESNLSDSRRSQSTTSKSDHPEEQHLISPPCNNNAVCPKCHGTRSSHGKDIFKESLDKLTNTVGTSPKSQKIVIDSSRSLSDQNEIHAIVKDEVVSFKWYSAMPDLDSVLRNGRNVHYSMSNLKSFYTNVKVGYLKIGAGLRKPMSVLKNCVMLYFVERGEGIFRMSGREIAGRIGSTVFIPLGVEYTITNSNTEDLILKFVVMSPTV